jgi:hypothetical protein
MAVTVKTLFASYYQHEWLPGATQALAWRSQRVAWQKHTREVKEEEEYGGIEPRIE